MSVREPGPKFARGQIGEPISMSLYPPNTEEKKKSVAGFMSTKAALGPAGEKLLAVVAAAKEKPHWRDLPWGGYGLCWGGKVPYVFFSLTPICECGVWG